MKIDRINRRMFLQGSGALMAIPFLPSVLGPSELMAATANPLIKYLQVTNPFGPARSSAYPNSNLPFNQNLGNFATARNLADLIAQNGKISTMYGTFWNSLASQINIVTNYHGYYTNSNHNNSIATCGSGLMDGADNNHNVKFPWSVDWLLEQLIYSNKPEYTAIRANLFGQGAYNNSHCFGGNKSPLACDSRYEQLEAKLVKTKTVAGTSPKADIFTQVIEDYRRLREHRRISSLDKSRFENFMDSMSDIKSKEKTVDLSCTTVSKGNNSNLRIMHENALEMIMQSFACGTTRIASYVLNHGSDNNLGDGGMHTLHHDKFAENEQNCVWRSQVLANTMAKAANIKDENGSSLFSNMIFYWGQEYSNANSGDTHDMTGFSCILGGGAAGRWKTGLQVDAGHAPVGRVLTTIFEAFGLAPSEYERSGIVGLGEYSTAKVSPRYGAANIDRHLTNEQKRKGLGIIKA
jgi:Protein of unknown function (DUF1552)